MTTEAPSAEESSSRLRNSSEPGSCPRCSQRQERAELPPTEEDDNPVAERCVFCHTADGWQYVPAHYGADGIVLKHQDALSAHCACVGCWLAWERKCYATQAAPAVSCPVCQRSVDVRKGSSPVEVDHLCDLCLEELLPPVSQKLLFRARATPWGSRACCCLPRRLRAPCLAGLCILLFLMIGIVFKLVSEVLSMILLSQGTELLLAAEGTSDSTLGPLLREVLCSQDMGLFGGLLGLSGDIDQPPVPLQLFLQFALPTIQASSGLVELLGLALGADGQMPTETTASGVTAKLRLLRSRICSSQQQQQQ
ncbi:unnamed protein product [Polarella glacialis]|uniref:Uncharacterized protein n=2 Tax=Polarella glacialis TaxID=89957 RepID=A0A813DFA8_POLGL|nr:unnamed protein product [Polarella glacialis]